MRANSMFAVCDFTSLRSDDRTNGSATRFSMILVVDASRARSACNFEETLVAIHPLT